MSPEQREAFIDAWLAATDDPATYRPFAVDQLNWVTRAGFSISLASVRDHSRCGPTCDGSGYTCTRRSNWGCLGDECNGHHEPCGGSPVVWAAPPDPESETP